MVVVVKGGWFDRVVMIRCGDGFEFEWWFVMGILNYGTLKQWFGSGVVLV